MPRKTPLFLTALLATMALAAPVRAQAPSTIDPAALDAAVITAPTDARAVLGEALSSDRALNAAQAMGLSPADLEARIAALDDATADRLAERVLAGGDTITISVTAVIIILLLLILIAD